MNRCYLLVEGIDGKYLPSYAGAMAAETPLMFPSILPQRMTGIDIVAMMMDVMVLQGTKKSRLYAKGQV